MFGVANLVSSALALTDEKILASYHRWFDLWTKGPHSQELFNKYFTAEYLTEDFTAKSGTQAPEVKGLDARIEQMANEPSNIISLIHKVNYEFVGPDGMGYVYLDLYMVAWNADKSDMCHYTAPVVNMFTVAEDGRLSSVFSHWNMMPALECMMSTAETKDEL